MSIKIFSIDKGQLFVFLLISALLHVGIILIASQARDGKKALPRLVAIDVIELPQPTKEKKPEEKKKIPPALLPPKEVSSSKISPKVESLAKLSEKAMQAEEKTKQKPSAKEETIETEENIHSAPLLKEERPLTIFPSKERLAELAEKYEKETPTAEEDKNLSLETSEPRSISYLQGLKSKIYHKWGYPEAAAKEGQSGRLWVRFIIKKDGTLEDIILIKSSGYPMLDDAALSAIRLAEPFYSFPTSFGSLEKITINASFEYIMEVIPYRMRNRE
jgi:protein TonB